MKKTILITGTSTGFGKLMAVTLSKEGHTVIAGMRGTKGKNEATAKELAALPNVEVVELDVTDDESVSSAFEKTLAKHGQIDVLVNNAGVAGFGLFEATSLAQMKNIFEVNIYGIIRTYQAVLPSMRKHKSGLIINISSGLGILAAPFVVPYTITKFGVEALTEGIRAEIDPYGIENVTVLPGPFPTEITGKAGFGPDREDIVEAYGPAAKTAFEQFGAGMFGKMAEIKANPQEVADAVRDLINMKDGTRPHQTVVNRMSEGLEQAYADSKIAVKEEWRKKMGWA